MTLRSATQKMADKSYPPRGSNRNSDCSLGLQSWLRIGVNAATPKPRKLLIERTPISAMSDIIRNVFISHIHEDDGGLADLKELVARHGLLCRDGSITTGKFNSATNDDYIKYQILAPRINWASVLVVYVSPQTKNSDYVNWEIEYAHKQGKRIVGVWERGARDCEVPEALNRYHDALVGWNGESIIDAITGKYDQSHQPDGSQHDYRQIKRFSCG